MDGERAVGVVLESGEELQAKRILSSAGSHRDATTVRGPERTKPDVQAS